MNQFVRKMNRKKDEMRSKKVLVFVTSALVLGIVGVGKLYALQAEQNRKITPDRISRLMQKSGKTPPTLPESLYRTE